jgi:hypothetical protein
VQRCPLEKAGLIQQQTDNDDGDKRCRGVPDDIPDYRNIVNVNHAAGQRQHGANSRAPADTQSFGLPDDQHQRKQKNCPARNIAYSVISVFVNVF